MASAPPDGAAHASDGTTLDAGHNDHQHRRRRTHASPRRNGRLGVEHTQLPFLPPLHTHAKPRVAKSKQQTAELEQVAAAFEQRLQTNLELYSFDKLLDAVRRHQAPPRDDQVEHHGDCFSATKLFLTQWLASHPFVAQFLVHLTQQMQNLSRQKLKQEAQKTDLNASHRNDLENDEEGDDGNSESSNQHSSSDSESDSTSDTSEDQPIHDVRRLSMEARKFPKSNTFRRSRKCREFPPTRVPPSEHIKVSCTYTPFDLSTRKSDIASITLDDAYNSASKWHVVLFPKVRPSLCRPEAEALMQWAQSKVVATLNALDESATFDQIRSHFRQEIKVFELICYELCRLVFDQCPTTSRFLHGMFVQLTEIAVQTLTNAERESQITDQRHKNVQLELTRLEAKLTKVKASLLALEDTLVKRQRNLLRERELIIRQRKKINLLLCADQVLIRGVVTLVQTINEIADDLKQEPAPARGLTSLVTTSDDEESDGEKPPGFTLVDELFQLVVDKYSSLQAVRETKDKWERARRQREIDEYERRQADEDEIGGYIQFGGSKDGQVIVLSITEIVSAIEEYAGTLRRVSRLVSTRSPDSSVGWEAQELWDQALFIPPHEEIQDLEREIQRLCRQVEQSILHDRFVQQLPSRSIGIQTDLSACVGPYQRQRANAFLVTAPSFRGVQPTGRALEQAEEGPHPRVLKRQEVMQVPSTVQEDQHELLRLLPDGFRDYIDSIPAHYVPHQLSLSVVHGIISNLFNHMWQLVQEDHHQPRKFGPTSTSHAFIQVAPIHEYVYRIYLNHFRVPVFVVCRLLDLIVSISRLDTQSCKVQLFCRLLGLRGVEGLPQDAFWFVLKTLHVLQRSCLSTGNYFLLDGEGENEFVPHASAWEALNMLFAGSTNDVTKRLRLRLSGLSSVYGTIWIPAYNIVMFVIEECKLSQDALRFTLEQKIFLDADNQSNQATKRKGARTNNLVPFEDFAGVFASMHLKVNRLEMVKLYRDLISQSRRSHSGDEFDSDGIDPDAFRHHWVRAMQTFINQAHQQQVNPPQPHGFQGGNSSHHHSNLSVGVHLGPPSDSMLAANEVLSKRFLRATWEQIKSEIIRFLDVSFSDIGLQVRLIQQMENAVKDQEAPSKHGWRVLQQLVQIAYSSVE